MRRGDRARSPEGRLEAIASKPTGNIVPKSRTQVTPDDYSSSATLSQTAASACRWHRDEQECLMQIGPLDLPEEILTALEEKRLVIFAGAGVSIPPPANLPSFRGLVEGIEGRELDDGELGQMDRVLGRARRAGTPDRN